MGEAHVADIGRQLLGQLAIGQPFVAALAPPRAEMDLVDRHRRAQRVDARRRRARARQSCLVEDDGGRLRPHLGGKCHRIGFQRQHAGPAADDLEFVVVAGAWRAGRTIPNSRLPRTRIAWRRAVPEIEVADHADAPGVGREHHERDAIDAFERHRMRAELVVEAQMGAFAEQIKIEIGQDRRKAIGVFEIDDVVAEARA